MVEKKKIVEISDKIKARFHPLKIILFGSYAWGKPTSDSDIDLFLIMDSNLRRDDRAVQVSDLFLDRTFPLDIIVYTPEEVEMSIKRDNPFT